MTTQPEVIILQREHTHAHELLDGLHVPAGDLVTRLNTLADVLRRFVLAFVTDREESRAMLAGQGNAEHLVEAHWSLRDRIREIADLLTDNISTETPQRSVHLIDDARLIIADYKSQHELEHGCESDPCDNCSLARAWLQATEPLAGGPKR